MPDPMCNFICISVLMMLTGISSFFAIDALVSCNRDTMAIYSGNVTRTLTYQANGKIFTFTDIDIPSASSTIPICYHFIQPEQFEIGQTSYISLPGTIALFWVAGTLLTVTLIACCACCIRRSRPVEIEEQIPQQSPPSPAPSPAPSPSPPQRETHIIDIPMTTLTTNKKEGIIIGQNENTQKIYIIENPQ